jgi:hypothetical protein
LRGGFDVGVFGKRIHRWLEEGGTPDKWVCSVSDTTEMGSVAARELDRRPGSAQGGGTTRARGSDGPRGKWAARPKARKNKIFIFFYLFNYFKAFSNDFKT